MFLRNCWCLAAWSDEIGQGNPAIAPQIHDALVAAFAGEDAPMLEAQTRRLAGRDFWSLKPALLPSDEGAVMVRRLLDRMIAEESKGIEQ